MNRLLLKYGLLLGISSILLFVVDYYLLGYQFSILIRWALYSLLFIGIPVLSSIKVKRNNNNIITYSDTFKAVFLCYSIGYVISAIFGIFHSLVNPESVIVLATSSNFDFLGADNNLEGQIMTLKLLLSRGTVSNAIMSIYEILPNLLIYSVVAAIISLFIRTKTPTVNNPKSLKGLE